MKKLVSIFPILLLISSSISGDSPAQHSWNFGVYGQCIHGYWEPTKGVGAKIEANKEMLTGNWGGSVGIGGTYLKTANSFSFLLYSAINDTIKKYALKDSMTILYVCNIPFNLFFRKERFEIGGFIDYNAIYQTRMERESDYLFSPGYGIGGKLIFPLKNISLFISLQYKILPVPAISAWGGDFSYEFEAKYLGIFSLGMGLCPKLKPKTGTIIGKVVDKGTARGIKAYIHITSDLLAHKELDTTVATDEQGNYEVILPVGEVQIAAYALEKKRYKSVLPQKIIVAEEFLFLNFILEQNPAILRGTITDSVSDMPCLADISFPQTKLPMIASNLSGIYRVELPAGDYVIRVEKPDYLPWTQPVTCKAGETTVLNVKLSPVIPVIDSVVSEVSEDAILMVKVTDSVSHMPCPADISFPGTQFLPIPTNSSGICRVKIPAGTYRIRVEKSGYPPYEDEITCKAAETTVKNIEISSAPGQITTISGQVLDVSSSRPIKNAKISFLNTEFPSILTDTSGRYNSEVPAGKYDVKIEAQGYDSDIQQIICQTGKSSDNIFTLKKNPLTPTPTPISYKWVKICPNNKACPNFNKSPADSTDTVCRQCGEKLKKVKK